MEGANFEGHVEGSPRDLKSMVLSYLGHFTDPKKHNLADVVYLVSSHEQAQQTIMTSVANAVGCVQNVNTVPGLYFFS